ncbi:hypothetical protein ACFWM1_17175 [Nocardia sp. NPDC058379]|uniref:hypothetical protein n=1 Tax=unclassified Nocardia TaxID=2637762 RepID=UPI0036507C6C
MSEFDAAEMTAAARAAFRGVLLEVTTASDWIDTRSHAHWHLGAIARLAMTFDRREPTIRDWIAAARRRGFLAPVAPGRRSVAPGPNLPTPDAAP